MKLAVIVGRFQTHQLTEGHKSLIDIVYKECDEMLILIGVSSVRNTKNEPLPFSIRKKMIEEYCVPTCTNNQPIKFPTILSINDLGNVEAWNKQLDMIIQDHTERSDQIINDVIIYGGRDSVVGYYEGKYKTKLIPEILSVSATKNREAVKNGIIHHIPGFDTEEFRMGMIYATHVRYPAGFPTADAACFKIINSVSHLLLCRKPNRTTWQLPGGFFDPELDKSLENTALRELFEECNVSADITNYHGSYVVDDFRYRKEIDKIITSVFQCEWIEGEPSPNDDIESVKWFPVNDIVENLDSLIYPAHQQIIFNVIHNS